MRIVVNTGGEPSGTVKCEEFIDWLRISYHLKEYGPWS
jgi:hypothetical protein